MLLACPAKKRRVSSLICAFPAPTAVDRWFLSFLSPNLRGSSPTDPSPCTRGTAGCRDCKSLAPPLRSPIAQKNAHKFPNHPLSPQAYRRSSGLSDLPLGLGVSQDAASAGPAAAPDRAARSAPRPAPGAARPRGPGPGSEGRGRGAGGAGGSRGPGSRAGGGCPRRAAAGPCPAWLCSGLPRGSLVSRRLWGAALRRRSPGPRNGRPPGGLPFPRAADRAAQSAQVWAPPPCSPQQPGGGNPNPRGRAWPHRPSHEASLGLTRAWEKGQADLGMQGRAFQNLLYGVPFSDPII